ncbi:MAG: glycoside hydrolase family protein [Deltaproteobacteria bacterium]|nr:glycoside hydrolase family protein [Deltaproteobacteria bacterium]
MRSHHFPVPFLLIATIGLMVFGCDPGDAANDTDDVDSASSDLSSDSPAADKTDSATDAHPDSAFADAFDTASDVGPDTSGGIDSGGITHTDSATDTGDESGDTATETASGTVQPPSKSCKRGVAYGHHTLADMQALSAGVTWWYNWYFAPDSELRGDWQRLGVEFVPMRWGKNYDIADVAANIAPDAGYLLGFNEPNFFSQANLSATEAAAMWPELETIANERGLKLVSPAVNFCGGGCHGDGPVDYLNDFFAACSNCRVDAIAIHIYVECDENSDGLKNNRAQWLINHVEMYKAAFARPLWLTEFACSGSPSKAEQKTFLQDAVAYLENEPRIERYAWFAGRADNMTNVDLLGAAGELTELGQAYVNAPYNEVCP